MKRATLPMIHACGPHPTEGYMRDFKRRAVFRATFGFAVPDGIAVDYTVNLVRKQGAMLEVGCGLGMFASLVTMGLGTESNARIIATDPNVHPDHQPFIPVVQLDAVSAVKSYLNVPVLAFLWPSYAAAWPYESLKEFVGSMVLYWGEEEGGCTADDRFHEHLKKHYRLAFIHATPRWSGIHDAMMVYVAKRFEDPVYCWAIASTSRVIGAFVLFAHGWTSILDDGRKRSRELIALDEDFTKESTEKDDQASKDPPLTLLQLLLIFSTFSDDTMIERGGSFQQQWQLTISGMRTSALSLVHLHRWSTEELGELRLLLKLWVDQLASSPFSRWSPNTSVSRTDLGQRNEKKSFAMVL